MTIYFYGAASEPYGCFSNFSEHGFTLDDQYWPTSEHFFQAQKFAGTSHCEAIRAATTPKRAAQMGRDRKRPLRADWEQIKETIMQRGVLAKFTAHADIREVLLSTGEEDIVENAPNDYYWGCGRTGTGKNRLGYILIEVRTILSQQTDPPKEIYSTHDTQ